MKSCLNFYLKNKQLHTSWMLLPYEKHLIATEPIGGSSLRNEINTDFHRQQTQILLRCAMIPRLLNPLVGSVAMNMYINMLNGCCRVRLSRTQVNNLSSG